MRIATLAGPTLALLALLAPALAGAPLPVQAEDREGPALELVLMVDVSASVDDEEFRLQRVGLAGAFVDARVLAAIRGLAPRGMAVAVVQWADRGNQHLAVDWAHLRGDADALAFAGRIAAMPRRARGAHTAIGDALAFALNEVRTNAYAGLRQVIDVSADGHSNGGRMLAGARREVLGNGITINGLAILNEVPLLEEYFRKQVIGGAGAFVVIADDYAAYAAAIRQKLEREIGSVPLTGLPRPKG